MDYTTNLNLIKPAKAEQFNIDYHNTNSDIIDAAIKAEVDTRLAEDANLQSQINENRNESRRIGTVPISKGGTGETTAQAALNALHGSVHTENAVEADDEVTFIRRTAADLSTETPERIDLKDVTVQTLAEKVYDLIRGDTSLFDSLKNGLVPKTGNAGSATFLSAAGTWDTPGFSESLFDISSSQQITVVSNLIYTVTVAQAVTVVLNDCDKKGVTATFMNTSSYRLTLSLSFFGGNDTCYVESGETVRLWWTGSEWLNLALSAHAVNSLYWSSKSTDPKNVFGGTWTRIKDRFVLAAGDTYANGATGGQATVQLTESQLPAHKHSFTPDVSIDSASTEHSHTVSVGNVSGSGDTWSHRHRQLAYDGSRSGISNVYGGSTLASNCTADSSVYLTNTYYNGYEKPYIESTNLQHSHTASCGNMSQNSTHTHNLTIKTTDTQTKGDGNSFSIMNPYIVKYCWERTA